jgi:hypothetical protein
MMMNGLTNFKILLLAIATENKISDDCTEDGK